MLAVWGPYFRVSLSVMVTSFTTETSVLLNFGMDGKEQLFNFNYAPRITLKDNTLTIISPVSDISHSSFDYTIEADRWYQIQILQNKTNQQVSSDGYWLV